MVRRHILILFTAISLLSACGPSTGAAAGSTGPSASPTASEPTPNAASSASSPTPASSADIRVTRLTLKADPADHIGACPLLITFDGHITATGGPGTVSYRWVSSDGDASPVKTVDVGASGGVDVSSTWTVDPTHLPTHAGWSSIELAGAQGTATGGVEPARANFTFTCDTDDDTEAIGFGIGGSDADCSIKTPKETFATTDAVRVVANWWPSLADGTTVTILLQRDGTVVDGYPVTTHLHESTKCIHGAVSQGFLAPGHYRLDVAPDTARAIDGEFDVK